MTSCACAALSTQGTSATFMLARLFKLPRLMRTARIIKNFHQLSKTTAFQLSYVLFCTFTLAHWAACGFFFLARWEVRSQKQLLVKIATSGMAPRTAMCHRRQCWQHLCCASLTQKCSCIEPTPARCARSLCIPCHAILQQCEPDSYVQCASIIRSRRQRTSTRGQWPFGVQCLVCYDARHRSWYPSSCRLSASSAKHGTQTHDVALSSGAMRPCPTRTDTSADRQHWR